MYRRTSIVLFLLFISLLSVGQIKHFTTIHPDVDGDGVEDFTFKHSYRRYWGGYSLDVFWARVYPENGAEIACDLISPGTEHVTYLEYNDTINEDLNWKTDSSYIYSSLGIGPGSWNVSKDYFVGIRIKKGESYYYGWIRFKGNTDHYLEVSRDAAIQTKPDTPIKAGEGIVSIVPVVDKVHRENNNTEWSDYKAVFFPPYFESFVSGYRVFVVKHESSDNINVDQLLAAPETSYQNVDAGSFEYNVILNDSLLDLDNEQIMLDEKYQICVLALSNNTDTFPHAYTLTDTFKVTTSLAKLENVKAFDVNDLGNSRDIQVVFDKNVRDDFVKEYRVMILPSDSSASFNLEKALAVPPDNSHAILPINDSVYTIENMEITDIYGNPIEQNRFYKAFILSVHDEIKSSVSSLSVSNAFSLNIPTNIYAGQKEGDNIIYVLFKVSDYSSYDTQYLDFDNDGHTELTIEVIAWEPYTSELHIVVFASNGTEIIYSENDSIAMNLQVYTTIDNSYNWSSDELLLIDRSSYRGVINWTSSGEFHSGKGILGFRKTVMGETVYGWLKLGRDGRIEEYAIKSKFLSTLPDSIENSVLLFPNPNIDRILNIFLTKYNESFNYEIDIINLSGVTEKTIKISNKISRISLADLPRGMYSVRFRSPIKQETHKIILL